MIKYILPLLLISSSTLANTCEVNIIDLKTDKNVLSVRTKANFKINADEIIWQIGDSPKQVCDIKIRVKEFSGDLIADCYHDNTDDSFTVVRDNTLMYLSECE